MDSGSFFGVEFEGSDSPPYCLGWQGRDREVLWGFSPDHVAKEINIFKGVVQGAQAPCKVRVGGGVEDVFLWMRGLERGRKPSLQLRAEGGDRDAF